MSAWLALSIGFLLVACLGAFHHLCLRLLDRLSGKDRSRPNRTVFLVFIGLLFVHTAEILLCAAFYKLVTTTAHLQTDAALIGTDWSDYVYFSGINFSTLGYTQIEVSGAMRMINMMQSLGGFMILTWSATFIYAAWSRAFRTQQ